MRFTYLRSLADFKIAQQESINQIHTNPIQGTSFIKFYQNRKYTLLIVYINNTINYMNDNNNYYQRNTNNSSYKTML